MTPYLTYAAITLILVAAVCLMVWNDSTRPRRPEVWSNQRVFWYAKRWTNNEPEYAGPFMNEEQAWQWARDNERL